MNSAHIRVYGNVVLASSVSEPAGRRGVVASGARLAVVDGMRGAPVVAPERQLWAPDAYASCSAKAAAPASLIRAAVAGIAIIVVLFAATMAHGAARATAEAAAIEAAGRTEISVAPGESLWSLAEAHPIEGLDAGRTVEVIRSWNDLESSMLRVGMELTVPVLRQ